ncbi:MAG TPA: nucleotide exchange factor GrpE [Tepidisphaeraceae bacterium]|jgi:molecular chaperone GrpE|nr:nucleotide exchange factor GrpE [Tepidisphaeraceae bacterium]
MTRIPINDENNSNNGFPQDPESPGASDAGSAQSVGGAGQRASAADTGMADYQALKADRDSLFERLARATAEFKNSQRRLQQDLEQRTQYANSSLIKTLLPVIDNFERALTVDPAKTDTVSVLKGLQIVHDQLMSVLRQQQVEEIAPAAGTPFDSSRHEALLQQDSIYKTPTVVQLMQKGYALHGRTLRPAQVAVSKSTG